MMTKRKRITGRLESGPRGFAIAAEASDHWLLEDAEAANDHFERKVTAEGIVVAPNRLRVEWL